MKYLFAPGCALMAYKPHLAEKLKTLAVDIYGEMDTLLTCCFNKPKLEDGTCIITPCATCNNTYRKQYQNCETIFFLKVLAESKTFPFPDYRGIEMSIQDSCAGRTDNLYLESVRKLLRRMNINVIEADKSGKHSKCCGQALYGKVALDKVENFMKLRAQEMPCEHVVVYCASCIQGIMLGKKQAHYIIDLLFNETTVNEKGGITCWNNKLNEFISNHK